MIDTDKLHELNLELNQRYGDDQVQLEVKLCSTGGAQDAPPRVAWFVYVEDYSDTYERSYTLVNRSTSVMDEVNGLMDTVMAEWRKGYTRTTV